MTTTFKQFAKAVHNKLVELSKHELFTTVDNNLLWETYLKSFPEGSNPVYKTNTEHECTCCKQFVRGMGNVVAIVDGRLDTIWNVKGIGHPYDKVADMMDAQVRAWPIVSIFRSTEGGYGAEETKQTTESGVINWNHFYGKVAARHFTKDADAVRGTFNTTMQVFARGMNELTMEALSSVKDLIDSKALYRGEEHLKALNGFITAKKLFDKQTTSANKEILLWGNVESPVARFRNTVIGTLVQDLSEGKDLDASVRSFEAKVAPTNYKRTTALITPKMIEAAMAKIQELNLEDALNRRFAKISDVTINNVLWADNSVKNVMKGGIESLLMAEAKPAKIKEASAAEITVDEFMAAVVPQAREMALMVTNTHAVNFMSLTAPVQPDAHGLFKWDNNFAWSYDGNITDSIKERVKAAGGNTTSAKLRVSLAWSNHDDLDLHALTPDYKHIYFMNKQNILDVDMNAGRGTTRTPVENLSWTSLIDGVYSISVHQYSRRETVDVGYELQVQCGNATHLFKHTKAAVDNNEALEITIKAGNITNIKVGSGLTGGSFSQDKWGIKTEQFVKVNTLMLSPNYWDNNASGNKHWFFILEGCKNNEPARGIYNEFLKSDLEQHRKVFEVLGNKTKCPVTDEQLSGLGFSSTRGDKVSVKVTDSKTTRIYNVNF